MVSPATINVDTHNHRPGWLRKSDWRVRTTNATASSVKSDSRNQPVRNSSGEARTTHSNTPKVTKSKTELTRPNTTIKLRIKLMSQRRGLSIQSRSTLSSAMVMPGMSERKLLSKICLASRGKNGKKIEAP